MFKTLRARISRYRKVCRLVDAIRKRDAVEVAQAIDEGAPLDGWKAKGPYWVPRGVQGAPPMRLTRHGSIELAIECGCPEDVIRVLLSAGAIIPDHFGDAALGRVHWDRCERRHGLMKGRPSKSTIVRVCDLIENYWQAAQLQETTFAPTAIYARPRL